MDEPSEPLQGDLSEEFVAKLREILEEAFTKTFGDITKGTPRGASGGTCGVILRRASGEISESTSTEATYGSSKVAPCETSGRNYRGNYGGTLCVNSGESSWKNFGMIPEKIRGGIIKKTCERTSGGML